MTGPVGACKEAEVLVSRPRWSVVICTRDRAAALARCLESVRASKHPSFEVVVVDNSAGDPKTEATVSAAGARYVVEPVPGLSRARNTGASAARGEYVAFTDDDATVDERWLSRLDEATRQQDCAAYTGRILIAPPDAPGPRAYTAVGGEDLGTRPFRVDQGAENWFEISNFGSLGIGPNLAFRRSLFESQWGFPEHLGPPHSIACEEHYALFDLIRRGHAVAYVPDAIAHHYCVETVADVDRRRMRMLRGTAAYSLMLLIEERGYRGRTLRHIAGAVTGRRRPWRTTTPETPFATRSERVRAAVSGLGLYLRSWLKERGPLQRVRARTPRRASTRFVPR